jgi:nucleotide-binding universal stress UspA family protein
MVTPNSPLKNDAAVKVAKHASESGHWYNAQGQQIAEVMKADGSGYTKCTLAHARKLDLAPGCTTIIGCADKPALTLWKQRQAIMAALTLPRRDSETEKEWMDRVEEDMSATAAKAAADGSAIHAAIQAVIGGEPSDETYLQHVDGALRELRNTLGDQDWRAEVSVVSRPLGVATKIDMVSDAWILNWKSKDGDAAQLAKLAIYDEMAMQSGFELHCLGPTGLAAGLATTAPVRLQRRRAAIGFVSRTHCVTRIVEIERKDLERGFKMFEHLLHYWQTKNRFRPSWATE